MIPTSFIISTIPIFGVVFCHLKQSFCPIHASEMKGFLQD